MQVVVTGGTGFIGRSLVERLVRSGHQVTVLTRDVNRAARRLPAKCACRTWNPDTDLDHAMLRGVDAIVHLAGEGVADGRWTAQRKAEILESRTRGTECLLRALSRLPAGERPRTFVSASAVGWYGDRGEERLDETSEPGGGFLADVCRAWEARTLAVQSLGIRTVTLRIGLVLGRGGGALRAMLTPFRLGLGGRLGSGRQWMSWIHIDDVVGLLQFALADDRVSGPVNGVAPRPVRNGAFTRTLGRVLQRPTIFPIPALALRLVLGEMAGMRLASQRIRPRAAEDLGYSFRFPTPRKALEDLCQDYSHELVAEQWLARSPERIFPFFSDPANLERITPDFLHFQVLGTSRARIGTGTQINYALRLHGIPLRWQSRIEDWTPNRKFVDVQISGPYHTWHHTHEFEAADGGTLIRDRVRYELPLGALGDLIAGGFVRRDLDAVFDYRREKIRELLQ